MILAPGVNIKRSPLCGRNFEYFSEDPYLTKELAVPYIMGAYNKIYGEHCCQSDFLLKKILREEWGYDGVVISDWGAVHDTKAAAEARKSRHFMRSHR